MLKRGGHLVSTLAQPSAELAQALGIHGARYTAQPNAEPLAQIGALIDAGKVMPHIEKIFALHDAAAAQDYLGTAHVRGKVVLDVAA